jgi:preprotein translocase subunit SecG
MAKSAVFGLASGLAVVVLTLIVVALVNLPQSSDAAATFGSKAGRCVEATQDPGYGLSRAARSESCPKIAGD